jgi:hypothetical protein
MSASKRRKRKAIERARATVDYLIDDDELQADEYELQIDEYPIGSDFKWGLAYIEDWLDAHAADIAAGRVKASDDDDAEPEVETSKLAKVRPPAPATISKALRGRADAAEIKAMMRSAKVEVKPTTDIKFEVRALQSREGFNPNWNDIGGHTIDEHDEATGGRDLKEYLEEEKRKRESFEKYLALDKAAPSYDTPKAATAFTTTVVTRRVKISPKARTLLTIETAIRAAQLKGDKAGIGKLLLEAKASSLDHGEFMQWAERATGLTSRSCRNYMAMADQNGK